MESPSLQSCWGKGLRNGAGPGQTMLSPIHKRKKKENQAGRREIPNKLQRRYKCCISSEDESSEVCDTEGSHGRGRVGI